MSAQLPEILQQWPPQHSLFKSNDVNSHHLSGGVSGNSLGRRRREQRQKEGQNNTAMKNIPAFFLRTDDIL